MNNSVKIILLAAAGVAISLVLVVGGFLLGRSSSFPYQFPMAEGFDHPWMDQGDRWNSSRGFPGMGQRGWGMGEMFSRGQEDSAAPLTAEETEEIVQEWLKDLDQDDLVLGEVMVFDNHSYAQIMEKSTGIGAMEVLVDPATREVYPERGPNMMWNQKYSPMGSMHGRNWLEAGGDDADVAENMPVSLEQAVSAAQSYLDEYYPGEEVDDHGETFYGYYTLHVEIDGEVVGMLSVNGYNSQVFYHTWHGELLAMSGH